MSIDQANDPNSGELLWEPLSVPKRRRLQKCFEHGTALAKGDKTNHDYVNDMFTQCVIHDPGNLVYVEAFLDNLQAKYKNNKKGGRVGSRNALKKAIANEEWAEALALGPELLAGNPWDVQTLRGMAEACAAYGFNEVELRYLKNALDANPKDVEVNKHCATSLARMGQFDQAIACWNRINLLGKSGDEPDRMISALTLEKTRVGTGLDTDENATGRAQAPLPGKTQQDEGEKKEEPKARRTITLTQRQLYERAISDNPTDIDSYLGLANEHTKDGRHADAVKVLKRGLDASGGGDMRVRQALEDAEVRQMQTQLSVADKRASTEKTEEAQQLVAQMREQLNRHELAIYAKRAEQNPDDFHAKYELGVRLKRVGNLEEAIKTLVEARQDAKVKPIATLELGACYQKGKRYKEAMKCYLRSVELLASRADDRRELKLALYRAGTLAMGLKEFGQAKALLEKLAKIDANYGDVKSRLDKIAQMGDKG